MVYHGSQRAGFTVFGTEGVEGSKTEGTGVFFTTGMQGVFTHSGTMDEAVPGEIEGKAGDYAVFLNIRNPVRYDFQGQDRQNYPLAQQARELGADGAIFDRIFVAFYPNQIKSAMGNTGAFRPSMDDICFSLGGEAEDAKAPALRETPVVVPAPQAPQPTSPRQAGKRRI